MSAAALQYAVKVSPKARNLRLKMTLQRGLEVIVPRGFDPQRIPALLSRKKHWIESTQRRFQEQRKFFEPEPPGKLPDHVVLRALGETWRVEYREAKTRWAAVYRESEDRVVIRGSVEKAAACQDEAGFVVFDDAHQVAPLFDALVKIGGDDEFGRHGCGYHAGDRPRWPPRTPSGPRRCARRV